MVERCKILLKGGEGEIVEKKSRFIALTQPVKTEEEALAFIETVKKKYWDARHHCFAYCIGDQNQLQRCSDDGEPSQTAGRPMLEVILGVGVHNLCLVVTRYFGGTLLGTGGLVRAYSGATKEGLANSTIIEKCLGKRLTITTDYTGVGKLQYLMGQKKIATLDSRYTEKVEIEIMVPVWELETMIKEITETTNGQAVLTEGEPQYYGTLNGEVVLL